MIKLWTFTIWYVGVYGTPPNAICYVCGTLLIELERLQNWYLYVTEAIPVQMTVEYSTHHHQLLNEPHRDKTTKWHVRPAKTQVSLGIRQG